MESLPDIARSDLMKSLVQSKISLTDMDKINRNKNILIDSSSIYAITDDNGEALFNVRFLKGLPGQFTLKF
jgi:hypothetical protein